MPAPMKLPEWDSLVANTEEPPIEYKERGWGLTRKRGVSRYMNWWMNLVYQWIKYLSPAVSPTETRVWGVPTPVWQGIEDPVRDWGFMFAPLDGETSGRRHRCLRAGTVHGDYDAVFQIPTRAGRKLTKISFAEWRQGTGGGTYTIEVTRSRAGYVYHGGVTAPDNPDETIYTSSAAVTSTLVGGEQAFIRREIPIALDVTEDDAFYLRLRLQTTDFGGGVANETVAVSHFAVTDEPV